MARRGLSILVASALALGGCSLGYPRPLLWSGFRPGAEADFVRAAGSDRCPRVGVQNLESEERRILLEALGEVCRIVASRAFEEAVKGRAWLASCARPGGQDDLVSGDEAYRLYMEELRPFSVRFRKPWNAEAETQLNGAAFRIAIRRQRLAAWRPGGAAAGKGALINTLAHEMTHVVPDRGGGFRFRDKGHREVDLPATPLFSYGIGDLVQRLWESQAGLAASPPANRVESC